MDEIASVLLIFSLACIFVSVTLLLYGAVGIVGMVIITLAVWILVKRC